MAFPKHSSASAAARLLAKAVQEEDRETSLEALSALLPGDMATHAISSWVFRNLVLQLLEPRRCDGRVLRTGRLVWRPARGDTVTEEEDMRRQWRVYLDACKTYMRIGRALRVSVVERMAQAYVRMQRWRDVRLDVGAYARREPYNRSAPINTYMGIAFYHLAMEAKLEGKRERHLTDALAWLGTAAKLDPADETTALLLCACWEQAGESEAAEEALRDVCDRAPLSPNAWHARVLWHHRRGRVRDVPAVVACAFHLLDICPWSTLAIEVILEVYAAHGAIAGALSELDVAHAALLWIEGATQSPAAVRAATPAAADYRLTQLRFPWPIPDGEKRYVRLAKVVGRRLARVAPAQSDVDAEPPPMAPLERRCWEALFRLLVADAAAADRREQLDFTACQARAWHVWWRVRRPPVVVQGDVVQGGPWVVSVPSQESTVTQGQMSVQGRRVPTRERVWTMHEHPEVVMRELVVRVLLGEAQPQSLAAALPPSTLTAPSPGTLEAMQDMAKEEEEEVFIKKEGQASE